MPVFPNDFLLKKWRGWIKAVLAGLALLLLSSCGQKQAAAPPPPPEVEVAGVLQQDVPVYGEWVAQLNGPVNADITPKVRTM
jgi:hypothetical protein